MVPLVRTEVITFESDRDAVSRVEDFIKQPADAKGAFLDKGEAPPSSAPNEPPNTLLDFVVCI